MTDFLTRIRESILPLHDRIEQLPLTHRIGQGRVDRGLYLRLLEQLRQVHELLEEALARHPGGVYRPDMARAEVLERDIRALGGKPGGEAMPATRRLCDRIREWASQSPEALLGCLYVFEGSRMGSRMLARSLAAGFGLPAEPGVGFDYHLDGRGGVAAFWKQFKEDLAAAPLDESRRERLAAAAAETMQNVYDIYEELSGECASNPESERPCPSVT